LPVPEENGRGSSTLPKRLKFFWRFSDATTGQLQNEEFLGFFVFLVAQRYVTFVKKHPNFHQFWLVAGSEITVATPRLSRRVVSWMQAMQQLL